MPRHGRFDGPDWVDIRPLGEVLFVMPKPKVSDARHKNFVKKFTFPTATSVSAICPGDSGANFQGFGTQIRVLPAQDRWLVGAFQEIVQLA